MSYFVVLFKERIHVIVGCRQLMAERVRALGRVHPGGRLAWGAVKAFVRFF